MPIIKPVLSKLYVLLLRIPYLAFIFSISQN
jgi:hypothetical protein